MKGLDYVLLAGLWVEPRSGYDLSQWFQKAAKHFWAAHHSSIYPALGKLERAKLIAHDLTPSERGPQRKVYQLTDQGCDVLQTWLVQTPTPTEIRDEQLVKVLALELLPKKAALEQLEATKTRFETQLEVYRGLLTHLDHSAGSIQHSLGIRLTLMRGIRVQEAYLLWCKDAIGLVQIIMPHDKS